MDRCTCRAIWSKAASAVTDCGTLGRELWRKRQPQTLVSFQRLSQCDPRYRARAQATGDAWLALDVSANTGLVRARGPANPGFVKRSARSRHIEQCKRRNQLRMATGREGNSYALSAGIEGTNRARTMLAEAGLGPCGRFRSTPLFVLNRLIPTTSIRR